MPSLDEYGAGCLVDVLLLDVTHLGRQVQALQPLPESDDVDEFVSQDVGQQRLQPGVSPLGGLEDRVVLQADPIKISLVYHQWPGLPPKTVAERLGERGCVHF